MKFLKGLVSAGFNLYVALNMLLCAVLFFGASKPRETISGFVGRKFGELAINLPLYKGIKFHVLNAAAYALLFLARFIDWMFGDPGHCGGVAVAEDNMRSELYPEDEPQVDLTGTENVGP